MAKTDEWLRCRVEDNPRGLYFNGHPIVERWERPIQEQLAYLTCGQPGRVVLEIGFGLGMAAIAVRKLQPRAHYIVEAHPEIAKRAIETFTGLESPPIIIRGCWEETVACFRPQQFGSIIFDAYPFVDMPFGRRR